MNKVIDKANTIGVAFGIIKESNHFGIAAYYASMALKHDMIGIALTNTAALGVPTFSSNVMYGTNPIAFAAPADTEGEFILDMSTTVITRGKIEIYNKLGKNLPVGWAVGKDGKPAIEPESLLDDMFNRIGGGILPIGGSGEEFGGHKGYGLAVMVDILCSVLSGAPSGPEISDTATSSGRVSHFFCAIKIDNFRNPADFRNDMDKMLKKLRKCKPIKGQKQVYFAGLKEKQNEEKTNTVGIPLLEKVYNDLCSVAEECNIKMPLVIK
jgi:LDH2 family malate/lactate/ureidoglycolate dehydrogenase